MKKNLVISTITAGLLVSVNVQAADSLSTMFSEGKVSGEIREFSINREVLKSASDNYTRSANAIGGHLKFETADYNGLSFGTAAYTTNGFLNDKDKTDYEKVDPSLLGQDNENYTILGEAYLQYKYGKTTFKGGRQNLNTPLAGTDDARMLPNLFEAYMLTNNDIADTTITLGHLSKFAQGTFGKVYGSGLFATTGGYSNIDAKGQVGQFKGMGGYATGNSTAGVTLASATYTGVSGLKLQIWDYYAYDIVNSVYAQADYNMKMGSVTPFVAGQVIQQSSLGKEYLGKLDGLLVGAKIGASIENFTAFAAYTQTKENSADAGSSENGIVSPWGGIPEFTQGMVTRNMNAAGTKAVKVAAIYNWKSFGPDFKTVLYYLNHNMAANNGFTAVSDASETGFDLIYKPEAVKNLQLRLRGNFPRSIIEDRATAETTGWNEYRFILTYKF